jgi:hypothetical protein
MLETMLSQDRSMASVGREQTSQVLITSLPARGLLSGGAFLTARGEAITLACRGRRRARRRAAGGTA